MNKNTFKMILPGKWSLILFLMVFILFFAWGTTFNKDYKLEVSEINSQNVINIDVSPENLGLYDFKYLITGIITPIIGPFYLIYRFSLDALWWGMHFNDLKYTFTDYVIVLIKYYCILLAFDIGLLFSISLVRRKTKEDMQYLGSLILYRSLVILALVSLTVLVVLLIT